MFMVGAATPGLLFPSKKSRKSSSKRHESACSLIVDLYKLTSTLGTPTVTADAIELSSEDENEPKQKRPQPPLRRKTLVMTSSDVIDLCSDDDDCRRTAKSSPVRTRLENDITVILSSEDESQLPSRSQPKSGRPARLKKLTLKAQALLSGKRVKKASRDETRVTSPGQESVRSESTTSKRRRLGNTASQSSAASQPRSGSPSDIEIVVAPISDPAPQPIAENEGGEEDEGAELQQTIFDLFMQHNSEVNDIPLAALPSGTGDDGDEGGGAPHDADLRAAQEEPQSLPTQPGSDVISPEYLCSPAPMHDSTGASDLAIPFSEQNAQSESSGPHKQSEPESHHSLDNIPDDAENEVHTMQDAILLPSVRKESSMDKVEDFLHPVEHSSCVGASDFVVPSEEPQDDFVSGTINKNHHVESSGTNLTARPSAPPSPTNVETGDDKGTQDALAQDGGRTSELEPLDSDIPLETHTPLLLPDDAASEEMNLQDELPASFKQQEPVLEDSPPDTLTPTAGDSSISSPGVPSASWSKTIDPDDTSPYLPPHPSYAPPPRNRGSVSPAPIEGSIVEGERDARRDSAFATGVAEKPLPTESEESGPSESNTEFVLPPEQSPVSISAESQSIYNDDSGDVQMQKPLLQSLSSNEGSTEERAANENRDEHGSTGQAEEERSTTSDPDPDIPHLSATPPLKYDGPVEEVISEASAIPASPLVSCNTSSTKPSSPFSGPPSFHNENIAPSYSAVKRTPISYSSCPPAVPPRLLTAGFFSRSFLQPNCVSQPRKTLRGGSPVVVEGPLPQSEPQYLGLLRECPSTPPVMRGISPQNNEDDNPETTDGLPASVVAQPSPTAFSESPCETAEEAEVDLQLTHVESDPENVPMPAAAITETTLLSETFKDVQERATRSPCAEGSEHEQSDRQAQPQTENGSRQVLSLDGADTQQSSVESEEHHNDPPARPCSASEQPNIRVKSLSKSSLDSLGTTEDSPAPTTPPPIQLEDFDTSSFFIRSASPIDFGHDMLKDLVDLLAPLPLDKDDDIDAYLLTHSFEYPDDVDVVV
jgi:hypothetical protein